MPDDAIAEEEEDERQRGRGDEIVDIGAGDQQEAERRNGRLSSEATTGPTTPAVPIPRATSTEDPSVGGEVADPPKPRTNAITRRTTDESQSERPPSRGRPPKPRRTSTGSFRTANEVQAIEPESIEAAEERMNSQSGSGTPIGASFQPLSPTDGPDHRLSTVTTMTTRPNSGIYPENDDSMSSLIEHGQPSNGKAKSSQPQREGMLKHLVTKVATPSKRVQPVSSTSMTSPDDTPTTNGHTATNDPNSTHRRHSRVQFKLPETADGRRAELQARARVAQANLRQASKKVLRRHITDGAVIKMERMLLRIDTTPEKLTDEFDENEAQKSTTRTVEKWREYLVVCRESTDPEVGFRLQMYTSRVIPAVESKKSKRPKYEISVARKHCHVNLYSSLDKTIAVWTPSPRRKGCMIYLIQAQTGSNAMEWYTFLRQILGWNRSSRLQINVPDLGVALRLDNPFLDLETSRNLTDSVEGDDEAMLRTMQEEQVVASKIIDKCMDLLLSSAEYGDVVGQWQQKEKIGLAWKRYDRLEWIHGANERKMYGTIAMQKSHDLELRPKRHYPTAVKTPKGTTWSEPPPVEGFLIRLTNQTGNDKFLGKMFFKRLYFSMHDQYLCFSRPARAAPPPPPKLPLSENSRIPSAHEIAENTPLIFAINPYPVENDEVTWLQSEESTRKQHDQDAFDEASRKLNNVLHCDGYIDLTQVVKVRPMKSEASQEDHLDEGSDFDLEDTHRDRGRDEGTTGDIDTDKVFELVLRNGLTIRLQVRFASGFITFSMILTICRRLIK
jgi:hypothetical protein